MTSFMKLCASVRMACMDVKVVVDLVLFHQNIFHIIRRIV